MAPVTNGGNQSPSDQYISAYDALGASKYPLGREEGLLIVYQSLLAQNVSTIENRALYPRVLASRDSPISRPEITDYIKEVFGEASEEALRVAQCESGFNPNAVNWNDAKITGKPSMGIFQLNRSYNEKYFDWRYNIETAYKEFYLIRGWQPWTCATKLGIF